MSAVLVDSNVLLDVPTEDARWFAWSADALARAANEAVLVINPIVYAEVSVRFAPIEELDEALPPALHRVQLPWEAAFLAGKSFVQYRRRGGRKRAPLPEEPLEAAAATTPTPVTRSDQGFAQVSFRQRLSGPFLAAVVISILTAALRVTCHTLQS